MPGNTDGLELHRQRLRTKKDQKIHAIYDAVCNAPEPVTASEVAFAVNDEITGVRKILGELCSENMIATRTETPEERSARFGVPRALAKAAQLYSANTPVAERRSREVISGFVAEQSPAITHMSSVEINSQVYGVLRKLGPRSVFTAEQLARSSRVTTEAARARIRSLTSDGVVVRVNKVDGRPHVFRIKNRLALAPALDQPDTEQLELPTPAVPPVPVVPEAVKVTVSTAESTSSDDDELCRIKAGDLKTLTDEIVELRAEVQRLKNQPTIVSITDLFPGRG